MSITDIDTGSDNSYRAVPSAGGPSALVPSVTHLNEGEEPEVAFGQFLLDRGAEVPGSPTMDGHWHPVPVMVDGRQIEARYRGTLDYDTPDGDLTGELRTAAGKVLGLWVGRQDGLSLEEQLHANDVAGQERDDRELAALSGRDRPVGEPERPAAQTASAGGQKTYLAVPFEEKDAAKAAGALWDKKAGAWFVKGNEIPEELHRFMPSVQEVLGREDPHAAFASFLVDRGAALNGEPIMDGQWHRVALAGDGKETNASYRGFLDGVPNGQFKNFKGTEIEQWTGRAEDISRQEQIRRSAQIAHQREEREQERAQGQQDAAKRAFGIWKNLPTWASPDNCEYLQKKQVRGYGVKLTEDGRMVIPLRDEQSRIWSLQFVGDEKFYLKDSRKEGLYHTIDPDKALSRERGEKDKLTVIIGEGYATGADVYNATKLPTFVAFDAENLVATAKSVREKYPQANILIAADDDHHLEQRTPPLPNKGLLFAQRAAEAVNGKVLAPSFTPEEKERRATDWNDLKMSRGEDGLLTALRSSFVEMSRGRQRERGNGLERGLEMAR
ncbi:hypothetical protein FMN50_01880 [Rhodobacterales bacterium]|nr:hypothetical protein FMN50_01880 [Rhodobacterales bacterium]